MIFPDLFQVAFSNKDQFSETMIPTIALLYMNSLKSSDKLKQLCETPEIIKELLHFVHSPKAIDWVYLFFENLIRNGLISKAYYRLPQTNSLGSMDIIDEQITILQICSEFLSRFRSTENLSDWFPKETLSFLVQLLYGCVAAIGTSPYSSDTSNGQQLHFEAFMMLFEFFSEFTSYLHDLPETKDILFQEGLFEISIRVLDRVIKEKGQTAGHLKLLLIQILGNGAYKHFQTQEQIRTMKAIPSVLTCCRIDEDSPFIREWSIFAIRNLCENNQTNQDWIASLQAEKVVEQPEEFDMSGISYTIDENGRLKPEKRNH